MIDPKELSKKIRSRKKKMQDSPDEVAQQKNASDAADDLQTARVKSAVGFESMPPEKKGPQPSEMTDDEFVDGKPKMTRASRLKKLVRGMSSGK
jgi:hypothetical protein